MSEHLKDWQRVAIGCGPTTGLCLSHRSRWNRDLMERREHDRFALAATLSVPLLIQRVSGLSLIEIIYGFVGEIIAMQPEAETLQAGSLVALDGETNVVN